GCVARIPSKSKGTTGSRSLQSILPLNWAILVSIFNFNSFSCGYQQSAISKNGYRLSAISKMAIGFQ
ncbi:MAG: hypothetical protein OXC79_11885, partial [Candidatus Poribacteria bacterium]|nr:hypothetical protein [Candidatus Poribacteria bacterium]